MITGSELVIAGCIPRKTEDRRFTCFGNVNEYAELVKSPMLQSDAEEDSEKNDAKTHRHNVVITDTDVPKMPNTRNDHLII